MFPAPRLALLCRLVCLLRRVAFHKAANQASLSFLAEQLAGLVFQPPNDKNISEKAIKGSSNSSGKDGKGSKVGGGQAALPPTAVFPGFTVKPVDKRFKGRFDDDLPSLVSFLAFYIGYCQHEVCMCVCA